MRTWLSEDPGKPVADSAAPPVESETPSAPDNRQQEASSPALISTAPRPQEQVISPAKDGSAPPSEAEVDAAPGKTRRKPILKRAGGWIAANPVWRTRGFWIGGAAVGVAMYAQKTLTVDGQVILSIRWYALAIFIMLIGLLGTYKNKSLLAEPVPPSGEGFKLFKRRLARTPQDSPKPSASTLPTRKAGVPTPQSAATTTLPVRTKRSGDVHVPAGHGSHSTDGKEIMPAAQPETAAGGASDVRAPQAAGKRRFTLPWQPIAHDWTARYPFLAGPWPRYLLAAAALALNIWSVGELRRENYFSLVGGYGWLLSLVLLAFAFVRERPRPHLPADPDSIDIEDRTRLRMARYVEVILLSIIVVLALGLRVFRLDDWTGNMHGDEGEFGMNALQIVNGERISPFGTGWFFHPNFSFFGIAAMMKIFGTGLFGLRILSALLGALVVIPLYLLVRMWFGVRAAVIAALLYSFMDVSLYFGKLGLNNVETPVFLVTGLYFYFKAVKSLRTLDFILAGYSFMLTLYFYFGGRLTPFIALAIVAYMFLLMPIVRLPEVYFRFRRSEPQLKRRQAWGKAAMHQLRTVWQYVGGLVLLGVASYCMASPWLTYFQDPQHQLEQNTRSSEKLIFNPGNLGVISQQSGAPHGPLYLGLRMPTQDDIYPFLPIVFEQTPMSVKLSDDGFWARVLWSQTNKTLSIFTYRKDESSFYTFTLEPAAKPIEAVLLILGIAWALWRWRDTRMATLSMWFWATILAGGALTIDAPYMPRLVGLIPALAIFIAIPINKMSAEAIGLFGAFGRKAKAPEPAKEGPKARRWRLSRPSSALLRRVGAGVTGAGIGVLLLYLGFQNVYDYFSRYMASHPNREHLGTANFVRSMSEKAASEGRPTPYFYDMAHPFFYWGYGINRFLNKDVPGTDLNNPSNALPILDNGDRDVVFLVWDFTRQYLPVLQTYYPDAEIADYMYGPPNDQSRPFTYVRVKREQIDARRRSVATYSPAGGGRAVQREEEGLGTTQPPPDGLSYPISATWATNIVLPSAGKYVFSLDAPGDGSLIIDGSPLLATSAASTHIEGDVNLARGPHEVILTGALADAGQKLTLQWTPGTTGFNPIPKQYLWNGRGRGLLGELRPFGTGDLLNPDQNGTRILTERVDGFLGFRSAPDGLIPGAFLASWSGTFNVTQPGLYGFSVFSNGDSAVLVDGQVVLSNTNTAGNAREIVGQVELSPGEHRYDLRYSWSFGTGYLEAYWTPPGGQKMLIGPDVLHTTGGIIDPSALESALPPVQLEPEPPAKKVEADGSIGDDLKAPKGVAVDREGNVYVGDKASHRIVVYSSDGKKIREWGKEAPPPPEQGQPPRNHEGGEFADISDVAVTQDGTVYVMDSTTRIQAFRLTGEYIGSFAPDQLGLYGPNGIAERPPASGAPGGRLGLLIGVTGQNRVLSLPAVEDVVGGKVQLPDNLENIAGAEGDRLEQPVDAVADPNDPTIVYAIDLKERLVQLKAKSETPTPTREWGVSKQWRVPIGKEDGGSRLAISPDGRFVYMSDPDRKRVAVINTVSGEVSYFGGPGTATGEFGRPSGIAVGPNGKIFVSDSVNNNVQVFSPEKVQK